MGSALRQPNRGQDALGPGSRSGRALRPGPSQYLTSMAVDQFDLGPAAAFSVLYFLLILLLCWLFYTSVMKRGDEAA